MAVESETMMDPIDYNDYDDYDETEHDCDQYEDFNEVIRCSAVDSDRCSLACPYHHYVGTRLQDYDDYDDVWVDD